MEEQVLIAIDKHVCDQWQNLMVPPISDVSGAIKALLVKDGRAS